MRLSWSILLCGLLACNVGANDACDATEQRLEDALGSDFDCSCSVFLLINEAICEQTCPECFPETEVCGVREMILQASTLTGNGIEYETTFDYTYGGNSASIYVEKRFVPSICEVVKNGVACRSCILEEERDCMILDCTNLAGEGSYNECTSDFDLGPTDTVYLGAFGERLDIERESVCAGDELPFETTPSPTTPGPTRIPTPFPSSRPTPAPTLLPTTPGPTRIPTPLPSSRPTPAPTLLPTTLPTALHAESPENPPTTTPTHQPTSAQPEIPTNQPTKGLPSSRPTPAPTLLPTTLPTVLIHAEPQVDPPTTTPTHQPTTSQPIAAPTERPTPQPVTLLQFDPLLKPVSFSDTTTSSSNHVLGAAASTFLVLLSILVAGTSSALCM